MAAWYTATAFPAWQVGAEAETVAPASGPRHRGCGASASAAGRRGEVWGVEHGAAWCPACLEDEPVPCEGPACGKAGTPDVAGPCQA